MKELNKQLVIIAVPIYKSSLNSDEKDSLAQLFAILGHYPIKFFTHKGLNVDAYEKLLVNRKYSITYFDAKYFTDIDSYSKLMCSPVFYKTFLPHKFLLIYQLDAWVFSDQLSFWCDQNYDFIGAPWFDNWNLKNPNLEFCGVGNGGFSLRKIKSHLKALNTFSYIKPFAEIVSDYFKGPKTARALKQTILNLTVRNNTFHRFNNYPENEDKFWGLIITNKCKWFTVPDMLTAAKFSFEINASTLFALIGGQFPFGCHALKRFDPDFFNELILKSKALVKINDV